MPQLFLRFSREHILEIKKRNISSKNAFWNLSSSSSRGFSGCFPEILSGFLFSEMNQRVSCGDFTGNFSAIAHRRKPLMLLKFFQHFLHQHFLYSSKSFRWIPSRFYSKFHSISYWEFFLRFLKNPAVVLSEISPGGATGNPSRISFGFCNPPQVCFGSS